MNPKSIACVLLAAILVAVGLGCEGARARWRRGAEGGAQPETARPPVAGGAPEAGSGPQAGAGAQATCVSAGCHATLLTAKTVHPAAEPCESCHESVATPHPRKGAKTFKLTQEQPALCYGCHVSSEDKKLVHFPVQQGMCTTCHDPHASNEARLLAQPVKALCESCHADHVAFKVVHGPVAVGDCTGCHDPHAGDGKALLLKAEEELCAGCHADVQEIGKKKNVHPALSGGCTSCHNPHGAAHPKLLAEEGQELCFQCHGDIGEKVKSAPVSHPAMMMGDGCASCHSPHASDNEKLLLNPERDICLGCHEGVVTKGMEVFHGPNNDGKCTRCHDPHGSEYSRLLVNKFPPGTYVPYRDTEYALCFGCHKRELVQDSETSSGTSFRDGDKNLHFVHVHDQVKGRSCRLCHSFHGSRAPMLIAEGVPFGKWSLPLKFVKTDTGGGCSPGCHAPKYYDRKSPGRKPGTVKASGRGS